MLIPVRCYTCGKVTGNKWSHYNDLCKEGKTQEEAFQLLGLKRYCCKRILLGHIDIIDTLMAYNQPITESQILKEEEEKYTSIKVKTAEDEPLFEH